MSSSPAPTSSKVSISPSFKGHFTNIMRQRQLFMDATRTAAVDADCSSKSKGYTSTSVWKRVSGLVPRRGLSVGIGIGVGIAFGLAISTNVASSSSSSIYALPLSTLRCVPLPGLGLGQGQGYTAWWSAFGRAIIDKLVAVNSLIFMGATSTLLSVVLLSALTLPRGRFGLSRHCISGSSDSESGEPVAGSGSGSGSDSGCSPPTDDAKFDSLFYEEYDAMMMLAPSCEESTLSAVPVKTPRCELVITYVPARSAFGYYTDRKDSIPYTHLETAARMFLVKNTRPDLAKLAYVDRRPTTTIPAPTPTTTPAITPTSDVPAPTSDAPTGGLFAMFKSYNRKPSSATAATNSTASVASSDTHFVYMGTMQDYNATRDKRSPVSRSSGSGTGEDPPYINVKYADFKSRSKL